MHSPPPRRRPAHALVLASLLTALVLPALPVWAASGDPDRLPLVVPPNGVKESPAGELLDMPLNKLMSYPGPLRLERVRSEATVPIPVTMRMTIKSAKLRLYLTNSIALVKRRSHIAIVLNDRVVTQIPLDGGKPTGTYDVALPADAFKPDFNRMSFRVAQHYAIEECEDPFAPELWTEVDTQRSHVLLDVAYRPIRPRLADLAEVFSSKDPAPRRIALMSASDALLDESALRTGALIAQGIALRLRFIPLEVVAPRPRRVAGAGMTGPLGALDPTCFGPRDGVLFGTVEQVAPFMGADAIGAIKGPYLGIFPLPADPRRLVVVVSGRDEAELKTAATAFAFLDSPYPDAAQAVVRELALPDWPDYTGRNMLVPGKDYTFKDLGFATKTLNGLNKEETELAFSLPPDVWVLEDDKLPITVHFSHGANLRLNSVINVLVNRKFADAIPIRENRARVHEGYPLELPLRLFRPGDNTITIVPRFLPEGQGACAPMPTDGLPMTLFKDSKLMLPDMPHFAEMPNLDLFGRTGFPYTKRPDGHGMRLWVGGSDRATIGAAWTVMGRLSQTTGMPLFRAESSFDPPQPKDDLVVVGPRAALPATLLAPFDAQRIDDAEGLPAFQADQPPEARTMIRFAMGPTSGDAITAAEFQSPFEKGRTVTVFLGDSAPKLLSGVHSFVHPEAWGGLQGSRTYWDPREQRIAWQRSDESFTLGHLSPFFALGRLGSRHPILFAVTVAGLVALLAFGMAFLLRRHFSREHQQRHGAPKRLQ